jgi:hypothetical protein
MKLIHWIAHLFGWNHGKVYTWWDGNTLMIGFRCDGCDTISGVHKSTFCEGRKDE